MRTVLVKYRGVVVGEVDLTTEEIKKVELSGFTVIEE